MTTQVNEAPNRTQSPESGYAPVNGLQMYYEIHGTGGTPAPAARRVGQHRLAVC